MDELPSNPAPAFPALLAAADVRAPAGTARAPLGWFALSGAFIFATLWGIRSFGIQDNNEGLYAEVAREMNLRGDWVVPHLNGVPYLEKPPLLYWTEALLMRGFGTAEWVVRLGPLLWFAATLAAVVAIGRQLRSYALGRRAALLLCSSAGVVLMSRSLLFDGPLAFAVTAALGAFLSWRLTGSRAALRLAYALLGLGVLAKGVVAVVLVGAPALLATFLARRSWRDLASPVDGWGVAAFAAVVVPWHVLASLREPGFAEFYFINEHVRRFLGTREPHDFYTGPVYYHLVRLPLYLGAWVCALPLLAVRHGQGALRPPAEREARRLLGCAVGMAVAFFSVSQGKANYYLLPAMPALALLLALAWPEDGVRRRRLWVVAGGVALLGLTVAAVPRLFGAHPKVAGLIVGHHERLMLTGGLIVACAVVAAGFVAQRRNTLAFAAFAVAGLMVLLPLPPLLLHADSTLSQRLAAEFIARRAGDGPVFLYRDYEALSSFTFYRARLVPILDSTSSELLYASRRHADAPTFADDGLVRVLAQEKRVWLVTTPRYAEEAVQRFRAEGAVLVRRSPNSVVIAVGPVSGPRRLRAGGT